jgi:hypothetical protein
MENSQNMPPYGQHTPLFSEVLTHYDFSPARVKSDANPFSEKPIKEPG